MAITTTAVGFILLALGLAFCGWWFSRVFRKTEKAQNNKIGILLTFLFFTFVVQNGVIGFGTLFFAHNTENLYFTLIISTFFMSIAALLGVYTSYYIFLPSISPNFALTLVSLLGFIAIFLNIFTHPQPFITQNNGIDLNMNLPLSMAIFNMLFISIGSTIYIFWKLFLTATAKKTKKIALFFVGLGILGIVNIFIRLILFYKIDAGIRTGIFDWILAILGVIFIITLAITPFIKRFFSFCARIL